MVGVSMFAGTVMLVGVSMPMGTVTMFMGMAMLQVVAVVVNIGHIQVNVVNKLFFC